MKIRFAYILALILGLAACNRAENDINYLVEKANVGLPLSIDQQTRLDSIRLYDDCVEMALYLTADGLPQEALDNLDDSPYMVANARLILSQMAIVDDNWRSLVRLAADSKRDFRLKYVVSTGETKVYKLPNANLVAMKSLGKDASEIMHQRLDLIVRQESRRVPQRVDDVSTQVACYVRGGSLIYVFDVDATKVDFGNIKGNTSGMHDLMLDNFCDNEQQDLRGMMEVCVACDKDLRFVYRAAGGTDAHVAPTDSCTVIFSQADLRKVLNANRTTTVQ